jgi:hypothetical protein
MARLMGHDQHVMPYPSMQPGGRVVSDFRTLNRVLLPPTPPEPVPNRVNLAVHEQRVAAGPRPVRPSFPPVPAALDVTQQSLSLLDDVEVEWLEDGTVWHLPHASRPRAMVSHPTVPHILVQCDPVPLERCCNWCGFCVEPAWFDAQSMTQAHCVAPLPEPPAEWVDKESGGYAEVVAKRERGEYSHSPWSDPEMDEWPEPVAGAPVMSAAWYAAQPLRTPPVRKSRKQRYAAHLAPTAKDARPSYLARVSGLIPVWLSRPVATASNLVTRMAGATATAAVRLATWPIVANVDYVGDLAYRAKGERVDHSKSEVRRRTARDSGSRHKTVTQKHRLPRAVPYVRFRFNWSTVPKLLLLLLIGGLCIMSTAVLAVGGPALAVAAVAPDILPGVSQASAIHALLTDSGWQHHVPYVDPFEDYDQHIGGVAHAFAAVAGIMDTMPEGQSCVLHATGYQKDDAGGWMWGHHADSTPEQFAALQKVVRDRKATAFAYSMLDLPGYNGTQGSFEITLNNGNKAVYSGPRRYSPKEVEIVNLKLGEFRDAGVIEPAEPAMHAAAIVVVPKKDAAGNWTDARVCVDYRMINKVTVSDRYGLHNPEDLVQGMLGKKFFSKLDLRSGFSQIPIDPQERNKTAFWWGNQLWQYTRMPFGMKNAPAKFQRSDGLRARHQGCC